MMAVIIGAPLYFVTLFTVKNIATHCWFDVDAVVKSPQSEGGLDAGTFAGAAGWNDGTAAATGLDAAIWLEPAPGGGPACLGAALLLGGGGRIPILPLPAM